MIAPRLALALFLCLAAAWPAVARSPAPTPATVRNPHASPIPAATLQLLVAVADTWEHTAGTLTLYERSAPNAPWKPAQKPIPVRFGRTGLAWGRGLAGSTPGADPASSGTRPGPDAASAAALGSGPMKREGDGKAPAGVFALGPAFAYDPKELGPVRMPVLLADANLICVDDAASPSYNTLLDARTMPNTPSATPSHEDMRRPDDQYRFGLVVQHNQAPVAPGAGSCIFLHIWRTPQTATTGCTAMAKPHLKALIARLDPAKKPLLVQLPKEQYASLRLPWGLP